MLSRGDCDGRRAGKGGGSEAAGRWPTTRPNQSRFPHYDRVDGHVNSITWVIT